MLGSAMFTTVISRMIMSWAPSTRASAMPRRSGREAVPGRSSVGARGKEVVGMVAFLDECVNPAAGGWYGRE